jgi:hypothetical protein
MTEQLHLELRQRRPFNGADPSASARLDELISLLEAHRSWITKSELERRGFTDRELRDLAEHDLTGEIFSYPGSPGYKAYRYVTEEEFKHCHSLRSQGIKMIKRFLRYWNRRHKGKPLPRLS